MHDAQDTSWLAMGPAGDPAEGSAAGATHDPEQLPTSRVLRAFALTEDVEQLIESCLTELRHAIPQLRPWRGRVSGRRVLGAHTPPEHGRRIMHGYTRADLQFEVEIADAPVVTLTCRTTIRGRDQETTSVRMTLDGDPAGRQRLATWIENTLLIFAAAYFESRRGAGRRPSPGKGPLPADRT